MSDLLETITHGPRGDIVSVYTTFPWPALCEEVKKPADQPPRGTGSRRRSPDPCYRVCYHPHKGSQSLAKKCDPTGNRGKVNLEIPVAMTNRRMTASLYETASSAARSPPTDLPWDRVAAVIT